MESNIQTEAQEAKVFLDAVCLSDRAKAVWEFAKNRGIEKGIITCPNGAKHSAVMYAQHLYINADTIACAGDEAQESYQILAILMALEAIREDCWGYGVKLNFDIRAAGIRLLRNSQTNEVQAFAAQEGTWESNRFNKGKCLEGNLLATAMYCADICSRCGTMLGKNPISRKSANADLSGRIGMHLATESPQACVEGLIREFLPAYLGEGSEMLADQLIQWLRKTDFYTAPASNRYHGAFDGGLVQHEVYVFSRLYELEKPETPAHVGKLVLAAFGHDLCKTGFYKKTYKNKKVYCEDGNLQDAGGRYKWESEQGYEIEDSLPIGHGGKSVFMLNGVLGGKLPEEVAAAIAGHMNDSRENPDVERLYIQYPFAQALAFADILASQIDEVEQ